MRVMYPDWHIFQIPNANQDNLKRCPRRLSMSSYLPVHPHRKQCPQLRLHTCFLAEGSIEWRPRLESYHFHQECPRGVLAECFLVLFRYQRCIPRSHQAHAFSLGALLLRYRPLGQLLVHPNNTLQKV